MATSSLVEVQQLTLSTRKGEQAVHAEPLSGIPSGQCTRPPPPKYWTLEARCLIVERRLCACGSVQEIPGSTLMLHYTKDTAYKYETFKGDGTQAVPFDLPRRLHYVDTTCTLCLNCFHAVDKAQLFLDLEPEPFVYPTPAEIQEAYGYTLFDSL